MELLLHACCAPCSLEPVRILGAHRLSLVYYNPNIHPESEYIKRLEELRTWATNENIELLELEYDPQKWDYAMKEAGINPARDKEERCRICYRLRLKKVAENAIERGSTCIGTTLTVSPYQHIEIIKEELHRAAQEHALDYEFEDYRPFYSEATKLSRELGMYRQNYCGCRYSKEEADKERADRKALRKKEKEARRLEKERGERL